VIVVTRKECGEKSVGSLAALSSRFIMQQMSIGVIAFSVSVLVLPSAVRKRGPSLMPAAACRSRWPLT
jgi:hypothetical protein